MADWSPGSTNAVTGTGFDMRWDLAVTDRAGHPRLVVEVKAVPRKDPAWATRLRDMLFEDGLPAAYLLLVTLDESFLWGPDQLEGDGPAAVIHTADLLGDSYRRLTDEYGSLGASAMEHLVGARLQSLAQGPQGSGKAHQLITVLKDSGLLDVIEGGTVSFDLVA